VAFILIELTPAPSSSNRLKTFKDKSRGDNSLSQTSQIISQPARAGAQVQGKSVRNILEDNFFFPLVKKFPVVILPVRDIYAGPLFREKIIGAFKPKTGGLPFESTPPSD
jgi:hypothetical protein